MSSTKCPLNKYLNDDPSIYEIGVDEAGRGPLFGRVYSAAVVLPKDGSMNTTEIRDSKKISKRKLPSLYHYILDHALAYHITFIEASEIDEINIREAVVKAMHTCASHMIDMLEKKTSSKNDSSVSVTLLHEEDPKKEDPKKEKYFLMIDGNDFPPYHHAFPDSIQRISYQTVLQGDNAYANIAAASILAKVARDEYIAGMCKKHTELVTIYSMNEHMGYGTKKHLEAIRRYGITQFHRRTYGCCKTALLNYI